jgi:hypothetical protein
MHRNFPTWLLSAVISLLAFGAVMADEQGDPSKLYVVVHKDSTSVWVGKNKLREVSSKEYTDGMKRISDALNGIDDDAMNKWTAGEKQYPLPQIQKADTAPGPTPPPTTPPGPTPGPTPPQPTPTPSVCVWGPCTFHGLDNYNGNQQAGDPVPPDDLTHGIFLVQQSKDMNVYFDRRAAQK